MKRKAIRLFALICLCLSASVWGQTKKGGQESCDGVLDVIPSKAMTFTRKRRPVKEASTSPANVPETNGNGQKNTRKKTR